MSSSNSITVVEQNFNFDLLDPSALLDKYVGRVVTVVHEARFAGEHDTREKARILSTNGGGIVLQYRDRIETRAARLHHRSGVAEELSSADRRSSGLEVAGLRLRPERQPS